MRAASTSGARLCARVIHAHAASSVPPASSASLTAKRASSSKSRGFTGGGGRMTKRDSFGPVGANSSGNFTGTFPGTRAGYHA